MVINGARDLVGANRASVEDALLASYGLGDCTPRPLNPARNTVPYKMFKNGIQQQMLSGGEPFYLGLAVSLLDEKQTVDLPPNRERLLESAKNFVPFPKGGIIGQTLHRLAFHTEEKL